DEAAARQTPAFGLPAPRSQTLASPLAWDGRLWLVEAVGETVTLQPDVGQTLTLPAGQGQRLLAVGAMQMGAAAPAPPNARGGGRAVAGWSGRVPRPRRRRTGGSGCSLALRRANSPRLRRGASNGGAPLITPPKRTMDAAM